MQIFAIIISITLFSILFFFFEDKREQKRIRSSFQQCYGQKIHSKTSTLENLDEISLYYNLIKKEIIILLKKRFHPMNLWMKSLGKI